MKLFLDTGGLLSVFDQDDTDHSTCSDFWKQLLDERSYEPVTSDYILDELTTRIRRRVSHRKALETLNVLLELVARHRLSLVWIDEDRFIRARRIFERFHDHDFSFTDCTSFAICRQDNIQYAFALDHHFRTFGLNTFPAKNRS